MLKKEKNPVCRSPAWNSVAVCFPNSGHCPLFSPFNQNSFKHLPSHTSPTKPFVFYIHSCSLPPSIREKAFFQSSGIEYLTNIKQIEALFHKEITSNLHFFELHKLPLQSYHFPTFSQHITLFSQFILLW